MFFTNRYTLEILNNLFDVKQSLFLAKSNGKIVGFVPTMGALHQGHMSLVKKAKESCDLVIVSVFVNPTQFNNSQDLLLYPRTPDADIQLLKENDCDIVFFPSAEEIYPSDYLAPNIPLGSLEQVMEGEFRPGHFQGVVQVVSRLFEIIKPHKAFFGSKDFQQVAVIKFMVSYLQLPIEIITCETTRSEQGLALSSRNKRLSETQLSEALHIFNTMQEARKLSAENTPLDTQKKAIEFFNRGTLKLEYLQIVNPTSLEELTTEWVAGATICIACFCGEVRLIDNFTLIPY